jgi:hypothetical protein
MNSQTTPLRVHLNINQTTLAGRRGGRNAARVRDFIGEWLWVRARLIFYFKPREDVITSTRWPSA